MAGPPSETPRPLSLLSEREVRKVIGHSDTITWAEGLVPHQKRRGLITAARQCPVGRLLRAADQSHSERRRCCALAVPVSPLTQTAAPAEHRGTCCHDYHYYYYGIGIIIPHCSYQEASCVCKQNAGYGCQGKIATCTMQGWGVGRQIACCVEDL